MIYRPTGQISQALIDAGEETQITLSINRLFFDLLA